MVAVPRLVIAAPASGSGKTTVACGLMAALRSAGLAVSGHKTGPDYIDPGYHALATGRPARNLDPFLCGEDRIVPLFTHAAWGADVAVVEGVMGLFDGTDPGTGEGAGDPGYGSTAHVARLLGAPVVLVIDAASMGRSVAAVAGGFARFDPRTTVAGVILNRVASDRHERLLRDALAAAGIAVYGAIRRSPEVTAPSRHLGLVPAAERSRSATDAVARLAALVRDSCDLPALLALARSAGPVPGPPWDPAEALRAPAAGARPVVAIAGGAAFTFSYTEHAELLAAAGLDVVVFDPLRDEHLPGGTAGVVLGGGFPEVHAAELSANEQLRRDVSAAAARGVPIAAECAGLLYLARSLDGQPMCGALPVEAVMTGRLTLGYRQARAGADSVLAAVGDAVRAHEFHRTAATPAHGTPAAWLLPAGNLSSPISPPTTAGPASPAGPYSPASPAGPATSAGPASPSSPAGPASHGAPALRREGHVTGAVHASYLHAHWAGYPRSAARFAAAVRSAAARARPVTQTVAGSAR
jgi:cobyrinic acid a,c-diamide synthase